jgi:hypothetical protein
MYHTLEFLGDIVLDIAISPKLPLERLRVRRGNRLAAQVRPHVLETDAGPVEVADLFFADGSSACGVLFEQFRFIDR